MSKDKRKKKFFQGMEHLRESVVTVQPTVVERENIESTNKEHQYIKKDLLGVVVLMSIIIVIFIGLAVLDRSTNKLTLFAEKITSIVIK
jgi:hypothetical protein